MMDCKCGASTKVTDSREVGANTNGPQPFGRQRLLPPGTIYVRRRRVCAAGHRFSTVEINIEDLEDG